LKIVPNFENLALVRDSVVAIGLADEDEFKPILDEGKPLIAGTGFLISKNGHIITAAHVLNDCFKLKKR
jgi:S1-C subfamily serine protease